MSPISRYQVSGFTLETKLHIPPPPPRHLARPRLMARFDQALEQGHALTLVAAPAGHEKTTGRLFCITQARRRIYSHGRMRACDWSVPSIIPCLEAT